MLESTSLVLWQHSTLLIPCFLVRIDERHLEFLFWAHRSYDLNMAPQPHDFWMKLEFHTSGGMIFITFRGYLWNRSHKVKAQ